jgi:metallo-beta-lactamase family protein
VGSVDRPQITFFGAADTVTGSRYLIEYSSSQVLLESGLFQGPRELRQRNWDDLSVPARELDAVVVSHAHLDHCGYLPRLWRQGYRGPIYLTPDTANLASIILRDSARLQEEDAFYAKKKGYSKHAEPLPLYDQNDAEGAISLFRPVNFTAWQELPEGGRVRFLPAGHILGAAIVDIECGGVRILHSGDLGQGDHPLLVGPHVIPAEQYDAVLVESTYGDREHPAQDDSLAEVISQTIDRGGTVLIPAFAVDRTEVLLHALNQAMEAGKIPMVPIYVDSPMAIEALTVYRHAIDRDHSEIRPEIREHLSASDVFDPGTLETLRTPEESKSINGAPPCIIISASGMATGGRVLHHLKRLLPDPLSSVILVGYQAGGTRGAQLRDGATRLRIHGDDVSVRAEIHDLGFFSVHADRNDVVGWLRTAEVAPRRIVLIHGEDEERNELAPVVEEATGVKVYTPGYEETLTL